MEDTPFEAIQSFAPERKINRRFLYLVLGIFSLLILFFGFKFLGPNGSRGLSSSSIVLPTNTPVPSKITNTPVFTPTPTISRKELTITVENGSGREGAALEAENKLKDLGYTVVASKNADNFDYVGVILEVKPSFVNYLKLLEQDLQKYNLGTSSSKLSDSFSSDALVIIGK